MVSLNDVLLAMSNIPVDDPIAEMWGRGLQGGYEIIEYTGVLPATLTGTKAGYLESYKIYGNTVQNGTPTPENPVTVVGCGVRTENLWDENYIDISETIYYHPLYVGSKKVTMSTTAPLTSGNYANLFLIAGQASTGAKTDDHGVYNGRYLTVTPINGYVTIAYRNYMLVDPQNYDTMLNLGSTVLPYEPYGYKLPMVSNTTTTNIYIGDTQLANDEYVDSDTGKIYRIVDSALTPTDPPVPFPQIPTFAGTTVIDYDGELKPSQMYIKYRRR